MNSNRTLRMSLALLIISAFFVVPGVVYSQGNDSHTLHKNIGPSTRNINPVHMVTVFTKFKGEAQGITEAPEWAGKLFDGNPGSVSHYFDTISFGQYKVTGEYLPNLYELPNWSLYYHDNLDIYTTHVLNMLDRDPSVDFSRFDNDGSDGIPGSGDDDGYVDYLVLVPMSCPDVLVSDKSLSVNRLSETDFYYSTGDRNSRDTFIKVDNLSGCVVVAGNLQEATGRICLEYCHNLGLIDLYDTYYKDPQSDSAGIGYWGFMGWGYMGWYGTEGPVSPCAYSRMLMGCIGKNNENLVDLYGLHRGIRISDAFLEKGKVYRIWIGNGGKLSEYYLLENRRNDSIYYDRGLPQNGLLIWHVSVFNSSNNDEQKKLCDLVCADGKYRDAGFPSGIFADSEKGGDNLDFWSHDEAYSSQHGGNLGDESDVFDGIRYTCFGSETNPNTYARFTSLISGIKHYQYTPSGIEIFHIHPEGDEIVIDVDAPPVGNLYTEKFHLIGMGYHRFVNTKNMSFVAKKANTLYLLDCLQDTSADLLVTVYCDSLTVDDLTSMNIFEVQKTVEMRIMNGDTSCYPCKITRETIQQSSFNEVIENVGFNPKDLYGNITPRWVQKVSLVISDELLPETIELNQNYPNPFNSQTTITYRLPERNRVVFEVFNSVGQKVMSIDRDFENPGIHTIRLNADGLSSGMYFYWIRGRTVSQTRKFLFIR